MSFARQVQRLVKAFRERRPMRAGSLIVTVFGDAIAPRGGTVWLGSLIKLMEPFGLSQRLVRTSVFRLAKDQWLTSHQVGRRSYYSLTELGRHRFESATRRIYARPSEDWDQTWCVAILSGVESSNRDGLRKELGWLGFGSLTPGVMMHPAPDKEAVELCLRDTGLQREVLVLQARRESTSLSDQELVERCWQFNELEHRYHSFLESFRLAYKALRADTKRSPCDCLLVRILLIHEYRKVLLRDPQLPNELLPVNWAGNAAYQLCRNFYSIVQHASEEYLSGVLETADGPLPNPAGYFYQRFDGLTPKGDDRE